ncbi:hypothetical protein IPG41_03065 [Candidatus Peregrinibacteria bacterium]|nr:MAG: hypothetical protein IPG41_03065 [Candidatus Peregrinibacteria bacterium]
MKSRRTHNLILMVTVPLLLFLCLYLILILPPRLYNDIKVRTFLSSLEEIKLPKDTKVLDSVSLFGILWENSNHCDVELILIVESNLAPADFQAALDTEQDLKQPYSVDKSYLSLYYYQDEKLLNISRQGKIEEVDTEWLSNGPPTHTKFKELLEKYVLDPQSQLYFIEARDQTFQGYAMNDFRCM